MMTKKKRRGRKEKKRGESTVGQIVARFPAQMIEVRTRSIAWGIPVEEVMEWGCDHFNRRREESE